LKGGDKGKSICRFSLTYDERGEKRRGGRGKKGIDCKLCNNSRRGEKKRGKEKQEDKKIGKRGRAWFLLAPGAPTNRGKKKKRGYVIEREKGGKGTFNERLGELDGPGRGGQKKKKGKKEETLLECETKGEKGRGAVNNIGSHNGEEKEGRGGIEQPSVRGGKGSGRIKLCHRMGGRIRGGEKSYSQKKSFRKGEKRRKGKKVRIVVTIFKDKVSEEGRGEGERLRGIWQHRGEGRSV